MTPVRPPLPEFTFPVYGLGPGFTGSRAVDVWNRLGDGITGPLWYLALAHTDSSGAGITVITDGRLDVGTSRSASALVDVARLVLLGYVSSPGSTMSLGQLAELVEISGEPPWQSENFSVDGRQQAFSTYRAGEFVAAFADAGSVVIGFHGPRADQLVSHAHLQPVNEVLNVYS
ncbi:hypothetical protein ACIA49_21960 [Kribbella sp. NPDC051587]|uniref:hypothetical protein n=1 Tax=Kribbella sp. NPDC051587 TaxID=3364119 RepID=UPI0037B9F4FD